MLLYSSVFICSNSLGIDGIERGIEMRKKICMLLVMTLFAGTLFSCHGLRGNSGQKKEHLVEGMLVELHDRRDLIQVVVKLKILLLHGLTEGKNVFVHFRQNTAFRFVYVYIISQFSPHFKREMPRFHLTPLI